MTCFGAELYTAGWLLTTLNRNIKMLKQTVLDSFLANLDSYDEYMREKLGLLRKRIRHFERAEANRILRPCLKEMWDEIRHPITGVYSKKTLVVGAFGKKYTLYPPN